MKHSQIVSDWHNPDCYPLEIAEKERITKENTLQMLLQAGVWNRNFRHNISGGIGENVSLLFDKIEREPAVVVAAGPSFQYAKELIAEFDATQVFCVDRALDKLQGIKVVPDYVVCRDATPNVAKYIQNIHEDTIPIISLMCDPSAFQTVKHCKQVYWFGPLDPFNPVFACWYADYGKEIGTVKEGGLVSYSAIDIAVNMGCDPIVLCGNDLAYDTADEAETNAEKGELIICLADGRWTKQSFMSPIECFRNEAIFYQDVKFYNASGSMLGGSHPDTAKAGEWIWIK